MEAGSKAQEDIPATQELTVAPSAQLIVISLPALDREGDATQAAKVQTPNTLAENNLAKVQTPNTSAENNLDAATNKINQPNLTTDSEGDNMADLPTDATSQQANP